MDHSFEEVVQWLRGLGSVGSSNFDGRTYHTIPVQHRCGQLMVWLLLVIPLSHKVENLGAYCDGCKLLVRPLLSDLSKRGYLGMVREAWGRRNGEIETNKMLEENLASLGMS